MAEIKRPLLIRRRCDMKAYEKDTGMKIPNWYLKLPQKLLNRISDTGLALNRLLSRPRKRNTPNKKVNFYL